MSASAAPLVAVVGGGIAGLSAALTLVEGPAATGAGGQAGAPPATSRPGAGRPGEPCGAPSVVLLESEERLGGKIRTGELDGWLVEAGPDAFLTRVPDAVALCRHLGLGDDLVAPGPGRARLWSGGRLRPLPDGLVLGVPFRLWPVARSGILSPLGLARAGLDLVLPAQDAPADRSVGQLVSARMGRQVHDRLVEPLVGAINAGRTDRLSASLAVPQLDAAARRSRSLILGLRSGRRGGPGRGGDGPAGSEQGPVFLTPRRGLGDLVDRLSRRLGTHGERVRLCTGRPVQGLEREGARWVLRTAAGPVVADAVILAVPAFAAAPLLSPHARPAARRLATIEYASVSLASMSYPASAFPGPLDGSGYLVPAGEGRLTTACTWTSSKWPHLARPGQVLLRVSTGRWGDDRHAGLDDDDLVAAVHRELVAALGIRAAAPQAWRVERWPRSFPQYRVGHGALVAEVEAELQDGPPLVLTGAAYHGIGIPACIAQGRRAALAVLAAACQTPPAEGG